MAPLSTPASAIISTAKVKVEVEAGSLSELHSALPLPPANKSSLWRDPTYALPWGKSSKNKNKNKNKMMTFRLISDRS
jgi:hypothetical protein